MVIRVDVLDSLEARSWNAAKMERSAEGLADLLSASEATAFGPRADADSFPAATKTLEEIFYFWENQYRIRFRSRFPRRLRNYSEPCKGGCQSRVPEVVETSLQSDVLSISG